VTVAKAPALAVQAARGNREKRLSGEQDGALHEHAGRDREGSAVEIEEYWAGHADPMSSLNLGEFRDDVNPVMVLVVEGC
jgi:hypothetical protein